MPNTQGALCTWARAAARWTFHMETEHAPVEAAGVSVAGALTSSDATSTPHAGATGTTLGLSVIIPAFNEQATIVEVVRRVLAQPLVAEVLVVDDGSSDGTGDALRWEAFPSSVRFLSHPQNRGKGAAIRTGVAAASQGIIIIQDADFEYDPADYPAVLQPIVEGRADVVYGSRFLTPRPYAFWLDLANRCLTATTNMLYGSRLTDMETCYKAFRADILKAVRIR